MYIKTLKLQDFRAIKYVDLNLQGKSTVIFGINGTGKSSVLRSINLLFADIINQIVNRKELRQNYTIQLDDIRYGQHKTEISAMIDIEGEQIVYYKDMIRNSGKRINDKKVLKQISDIFHEKYVSDEEQLDIPIFVNYGTNRLVLDIPLRIRTHHTFDTYSAFEKSIESRIDFRTFFEWYRNQEDYENEQKVETGNLDYQDRALNAVKTAVLTMLDGCSNLRVARKPRLEMKIDKDGISLNVSQMSDGEKCTMALMGDLARRLTLANPGKENPLLGEGIVLIDEIELHMHPSWQRKILNVLKKTFPNIQFIITTHSPIVLSEADEDYNLLFMESDNNAVQVLTVNPLSGYDTNAVLEQFMGTKSINPKTESLIHSIYVAIDQGNYDEAKRKIEYLVEMTNENHPDVIMANMELKRRMK